MSRRAGWIFLAVFVAVLAAAAVGSILTDWYIFDGGIHPRFRE